MQLVGELINASRKSVREAIQTQDISFIQRLAREQREAGADYIDINAGIFGDQEPYYLKWLVETVQQAVDAPCCIDSPDPRAIEAALLAHQGVAMINSISLEAERFEHMIPFLRGTGHKVVALCMADSGMPETTEQRLSIADRLLNRLVQNNLDLGDIFIDLLVQPVATNGTYGIALLKAIEAVMTSYPGVHSIAGLSNISFGLPSRQLLNRTFLAIAIASGLDAAILNPLDHRAIANIKAAEALIGRDRYCMKFINAHRGGLFDR